MGLFYYSFINKALMLPSSLKYLTKCRIISIKKQCYTSWEIAC